MTLVRPVEDEAKIRSLNTLSDDDLREEFLKGVNNVHEKVFDELQPKKILNSEIEGFQLAEICMRYVEGINQGKIPTFESTWSYI